MTAPAVSASLPFVEDRRMQLQACRSLVYWALAQEQVCRSLAAASCTSMRSRGEQRCRPQRRALSHGRLRTRTTEGSTQRRAAAHRTDASVDAASSAAQSKAASGVWLRVARCRRRSATRQLKSCVRLHERAVVGPNQQAVRTKIIGQCTQASDLQQRA